MTLDIYAVSDENTVGILYPLDWMFYSNLYDFYSALWLCTS